MNPEDIQIIGGELCIRWQDGSETYLNAEKLRAHSPSAENIGEKDILGNQYGGQGPKTFPGIQIVRLDTIGNYALRPTFSDGHSSGIYLWDYLRNLG